MIGLVQGGNRRTPVQAAPSGATAPGATPYQTAQAGRRAENPRRASPPPRRAQAAPIHRNAGRAANRPARARQCPVSVRNSRCLPPPAHGGGRVSRTHPYAACLRAHPWEGASVSPVWACMPPEPAHQASSTWLTCGARLPRPSHRRPRRPLVLAGQAIALSVPNSGAAPRPPARRETHRMCQASQAAGACLRPSRPAKRRPGPIPRPGSPGLGRPSAPRP